MRTGLASACPSCGAPLTFGGAHSLAAICGYCRSAVARRGVELELIGRVPDLVATDTRLALGIAGKVDGHPFQVIGHLQLGRPDAADAAVTDTSWDEWYVAFGDGTWGWLAEAQGRLHLTRPVDRAPATRFEDLAPGLRVDEPGLGILAVEEVGEARFLSAEGELPYPPRLGATYRFADLSAADGRFFTFDYGDHGDDGHHGDHGDQSGVGEAQIFHGRRLGYDEAGIADRKPGPPVAGPEGEALACPSCGASLALRSAETVSLTCPSCRSLLDYRGDGKRLKIVAELAAREAPPIPLGSHGPLDGEAAEVLGWLRRSTIADGVTYFWDEYLLHGPSGYRWLTEGDGQWHLLAPCEGGRVTVEDGACRLGHERFRHFQSGTAAYAQIQGEFYWRIRVGAEVATEDYVAPPRMLSRELDGREEAWSLGRWIAADEVWRAFGLPGQPPPSSTVGAAQPNPWALRVRSAWRVIAPALLALVVLAAAVSASLAHQTVLAVDVPLGAGGDSAVYVSEPFELPGWRQAVEITAQAVCENSWVGLDVALINDDSGESDAVGLDLSYYHGYDDGESWSEGSSRGSERIGRVPRGRYLLRVEPQVGRDGAGRVPDTAHVEVVRGVFLWPPLLLALLGLLAYPLYAGARSVGFERRRWESSDHPMGGST